MRTTITLPDSLYNEVRKAAGTLSPSKTVVQVFKAFLRQKKINKLINKAGKINIDLDKDRLEDLRHAR